MHEAIHLSFFFYLTFLIAVLYCLCCLPTATSIIVLLCLTVHNNSSLFPLCLSSLSLLSFTLIYFFTPCIRDAPQVILKSIITLSALSALLSNLKTLIIMETRAFRLICPQHYL